MGLRHLLLILLVFLLAGPAGAQLFRVNTGGPLVGSIDAGPDWLEDSSGNPSIYRVSGTNDTAGFAIGTIDGSVPAGTPSAVFQTERWENAGGDEMSWTFPVGAAGTYEVRLYFASGWSGASAPGQRVYDVSIEGVLVLDDFDIVADTGHGIGLMKSFVVASDTSLDIDFTHVVQNPLINAIEILAVDPDGYLGSSSGSASFGLVEMATVSPPAALQLTNLGLPGDSDITLANVTLTGEFVTTLVPQTLSPGAVTNFDVSFAPTVAGVAAGSLTVDHDGTNSPVVIALSGEGFDPASAPISFGSTNLQGTALSNPTSLAFGPGGRLYVSQQNGVLFAYTIQRNTPSDYQVTATEQINLVQSIPNHDDDGSLNPAQTNRQVTGLMATGTAANPVLYVTSSDPRIGAGGGGNDVDLDTNSGTISRLTWNGSSWDHVQIVRGLPRSEENHSSNGMVRDPFSNVLYVMSGGNTNKGGPSNNFAQTQEYALSAALLSVDLDAIEALPILTDAQGQDYVYDIPTLDDPTRAGDPDAGDPFGGNDGRNQARIVPAGPVQVHASGFRNAYDVVLTSNDRLYTFDNGPNTGWGGIPVGEGTATCTNETNETTSTGFGDGLHFVDAAGYYGGHPHPTRANPETSDLVIYENQAGTWVEIDRYDWQLDFASAPPVPFGTGDSRQCDYRIPVTEDGAMVAVGASTNGMAEYTASNFGDAMQGNLLAASFNGNVYRFELDVSGATVVNGGGSGEVLLTGFGGQPLDVIAQGDADPFPGTIFAAVFGANQIAVFEPLDFFVCTGADDPGIDEDGDGFDNADEIANATDPCSAGSQPPDADGDGTSDLTDPDDDGDGIFDVADAFSIDPDNGTTTDLPVILPLFNFDPGTGFFGVGFTGLMSNGVVDYLDQFDPSNLIVGGAAGLFTIKQVSEGDALGANDDQENAFLLGVNVDTTQPPFTVQWRLNTPYFEVGGSPSTPIDFQSFGGFIGTGSQDDYLKLAFAAEAGSGGVEVVLEDAGGVTSASYGTGVVGDILGSIFVDFFLTVDPAALTAQPAVSLDGGAVVPLGSPVPIPSAWLDPGDGQGLAVGVMATSFGSATPFGATWDFIEVFENCSTHAQCDDGNACTANTCNAGLCEAAPVVDGSLCDDGLSCTGSDMCTAGECAGASLCSGGDFCSELTDLCQAPTAEAFLAVTPGGGLGASTYGGGSLQLSNGSPDGQLITHLTLDLSTSLFPDIVFDPTDGTPAGDAVAKCLTADSGATATGYAVPPDPCRDPFSDPNEDGYYTISLDFSDFQASETFTFSVDIDPTSIQGGTSSGAAGSVSGMELTGAKMTVSFDDGAIWTADLFHEASSSGGGKNFARQGGPAAPGIEALGIVANPTTVNAASQTIRVTAPEGSLVRLLHVEGAMELFQATGFDVEPFEANDAISVTEQTGSVPAAGFLDFPVLLTQTLNPDFLDTGLNHFVAGVEDTGLRTGSVSGTLLLRYDPAASCSYDADCDNGVFCDGAELCDVDGACQAQAAPCGSGEFCDDTADVCELPCLDDQDCDGWGDGIDVCPADPLNQCGATLPALCEGASGNCGGAGSELRFDAGPSGPTTACNGSVWSAEAGTGLGTDFAGNVAIDAASVVNAFGCTDPATEAMVGAERNGAPLVRGYPVANGAYFVTLIFAETLDSVCSGGAGQRLMDVSIEGIEVLSDFDVYAAALAENGVGCGSLLVRSFSAVVSDGSLDLDLAADLAGVEPSAALKGIEIRAQAPPASVPAVTPSGLALAIAALAAAGAALVRRRDGPQA